MVMKAPCFVASMTFAQGEAPQDAVYALVDALHDCGRFLGRALAQGGSNEVDRNQHLGRKVDVSLLATESLVGIMDIDPRYLELVGSTCGLLAKAASRPAPARTLENVEQPHSPGLSCQILSLRPALRQRRAAGKCMPADYRCRPR